MSSPHTTSQCILHGSDIRTCYQGQCTASFPLDYMGHSDTHQSLLHTADLPKTEHCNQTQNYVTTWYFLRWSSWCNKRPCHDSKHQSSVPCHRLPGSIPSQSIWYLWWTKWHWDRFLFKYFSYPLPELFQDMLHTHIAFITDTIPSHWLNVSRNNTHDTRRLMSGLPWSKITYPYLLFVIHMHDTRWHNRAKYALFQQVHSFILLQKSLLCY